MMEQIPSRPDHGEFLPRHFCSLKNRHLHKSAALSEFVMHSLSPCRANYHHPNRRSQLGGFSKQYTLMLREQWRRKKLSRARPKRHTKSAWRSPWKIGKDCSSPASHTTGSTLFSSIIPNHVRVYFATYVPRTLMPSSSGDTTDPG